MPDPVATTHRLRLTLVFEYDATSVTYETTDPSEMVAIDQRNFEDNPWMMVEVFSEDEPTSITVEHVENDPKDTPDA